jgi:hypothetical protein
MSMIGRPKKGFNVIAYNAQKQRSKQMPNAKEHYFRDEEDNRTVVVTEEAKDGWFRAYILEGKNDDIIAYGFGDTRMAAIADLNDSIAMSRAEA